MLSLRVVFNQLPSLESSHRCGDKSWTHWRSFFLCVILTPRCRLSFNFFFLQAVFHSSSSVGCTSVEVMRNAVAILSAGWWGHDLAGKLTDVILFFLLMPRGRSDRPSGTSRHPSTRFWLRLRIWRMKNRHPNPNELQISAGYATKLLFSSVVATSD